MISSDAVLSEILGRLDVAVLERTEGGELQTRGTPPDWFGEFFVDPAGPAKASFFLADFLEQAAAEYWSAETPGEAVRSGIWEEPNDEGESHFFEAVAMKIGMADILLIEAADDRHDREQMFVQQWHVDTLDRRQLGKEIEKKEILLDCIVHDLTHPLSTMMVNLQHLEKKIGDEKLRRPVERALAQAERQRDLIRSISEVFRSDLSAFDPLSLPADEAPEITRIAAEIVEAHAGSAAERGIELTLRTRANTMGIRVVAEESHLLRVLENLVVNALRHSPENGKVSLEIAEDPNGFAVTASVEDEGPGVDSDLVESLFKPFVQGEDGNGGNAGLGLYFCKMMVELWGGEIGCRPSPSGGACFWFQLPVVSEEEEKR